MPLPLALFLTIAIPGLILFCLGLWLGSYERRIDLRQPDAMDEPFGDVPNPRGR